MTLFKRLLLTIFPKLDHMDTKYNPANLFINFISSKQYFSVVLRKLVENYKLNLFDINLNSFEVKIGLGDRPGIRLPDIENYYAYLNAANLNGRRFYSISNLSSVVSLMVSKYFVDIFRGKSYVLFLNFIITVYLLSFIFASKFKNIKQKDFKKSYQFFIDVFFNFFDITNKQTGVKISDEEFANLKVKLLKNIEVFFFLYYFYSRLYEMFDIQTDDIKDFFEWIFYDEIKDGKYKVIVFDFLKNYKEWTNNTNFTTTEKTLLNIILPADILIRFFLDGEDIFLIVDNIVDKIFDFDIVDKYLKSFLKGDDKLDDLILYLTDYRNFKTNFLQGIKSYFVVKFSGEDIVENFDDESDSFIGEEGMVIPERIKKESIIMEKMLNFYMSFIGGFWIGRSDNFYFRFTKQDLIKYLKNKIDLNDIKTNSLNFYSGLLYLYTKNVFYYKEAFENVRLGKAQFKLPLRSTFKEIYSNSTILKLFNETFLVSIFDVFSVKDIKIYIKNEHIINKFKQTFGDKIKEFLSYSNEDIIFNYLSNIFDLLQINEIDKSKFINFFTEDDIQRFKMNLYSLDFWINLDLIKRLNEYTDLLTIYSQSHKLGVIYLLKETLFGLLLYIYFLENISNKKDIKIEKLLELYFSEILFLEEELNFIKDIVFDIYEEYKDFFKFMINIDDNKTFLKIGYNNWLLFIENYDKDGYLDLNGEDIIWLKDFLRNITYYNKRYFIPKNK